MSFPEKMPGYGVGEADLPRDKTEIFSGKAVGYVL